MPRGLAVIACISACIPALAAQVAPPPDVVARARGAADALRHMGPAGADAAPALRSLLGHSDALLAARAQAALDAFEPAPAPAEVVASAPRDVEALIARLRGADPAAAAIELRDSGRAAAAAVPALLAVLRGAPADAGVRTHLIEALGSVGAQDERVPPVLVEHLGDSDQVAMAAAEALMAFESGRADAVAFLAGQRAERGYWNPERAVAALGLAATPASVELLAADAREGPAPLRGVAVRALGRIAVAAPGLEEAALLPVVEALHAVGWDDPGRHRVQEAAAEALVGAARADSGLALQALQAALQRADIRVRQLALRALARLGPGAASAAPAIAAALAAGRLETPGERRAALLALGRIGPAAVESTPLLLSLATDASLGSVAGWAVARVGPGHPAAPVSLLALLADDSALQAGLRRVDAALADATGAPDALAMRAEIRAAVARHALPTLLADLDAHRWAPLLDLAALGGPGLDAGPMLVVDVLVHAGPEAAPELLDRLHSSEPQVSAQAALALGWLEPPVAASIPRLVALLDDQRCADPAARALANLGASSVPALVRVLEDAR